MVAKKKAKKAKIPRKGPVKRISKNKKRLSTRRKKKLSKPKKRLKKKKYPKIKRFEDPLEISLPPRWLDAKSSKKILSLRKLQYRLWGWTVALSLFLLLAVAAIEILSDFDYLPHISEAHHKAMKNGDILAIFVIGLELAHGFTRAKNKALYLRQNWLEILAILPFGLLMRIGRAFEGLIVVEGFANLRTLQLAGKFGELRSILPVLEAPYEIGVLIIEPVLARLSSITRGVASFFFLFSQVLDDVLEYVLSFLKFLK